MSVCVPAPLRQSSPAVNRPVYTVHTVLMNMHNNTAAAHECHESERSKTHRVNFSCTLLNSGVFFLSFPPKN